MKTMTHDRIRTILSLLLLLTCAPLTCAQNAAQSPPPPVLPYNFDRDPSVEIIIFVLISAFFFMGFFSIYILFAGESTTVHGSRHNGFRDRSRRGLDLSVIETFPIFEYSVVKGLKLGKGMLECAVCLSEFEDDESLRLLPKCSHVFHPNCIHAWLASHTTCPVCRAKLVPGSDEEAAESVTPNPVAVAAEESDSPPDHVAIVIDPAQSEGRAQPDVIDLQNRPMRSKSSQRSRSHFESSEEPVAALNSAENKND